MPQTPSTLKLAFPCPHSFQNLTLRPITFQVKLSDLKSYLIYHLHVYDRGIPQCVWNPVLWCSTSILIDQ